MINNYFKIAWRNFYKQKFYTGINVFGLAMGITCTIVLFLFISFHLSFDTYHANAKRIYRTVTDLHIPDGSIEYDQGSPYVLGQLLKQLPAVANETALLSKRSFTISIPQKNQGKQSLFYEFENIAFTDNNWFKMFTYNWKSGNPNTALTNPYTAVVTSNLAKKYFNTDQAVGKTIRVENKYNFTITGVLQDNPTNTDIQANMFLSISSVHTMFPEPNTFWTDIGFISSKNYVFVQLHDASYQKAVDNSIKLIIKKALKIYGSAGDAYHFRLQPLEDIHFNSRYGGKISKPLLWVLAIVGFALILIACVNFVNMATAQSLTRAKEIGTRKVLGSSRKAIFWQFIAETAFVALAAGVVGLLSTILFLPTLNSWLQLPLAINGQALLFLFALLLIIVFTAGFYPAVILSGFKPIDALKNRIGNNNSSRLSQNVLIIFQNVIAQGLIVCTVIIVLQVDFLKNADLGFNKDAVIMLPVPDHSASKLSYFRNQLSNYPVIKSVSFCYRAPASTSGKGGMIRYDNMPSTKFVVRSVIGDENYIKTFGLKLLAGRNLTSTDSTNAYIVNQQVLQKLGIKNPGQAIGHLLEAEDFSEKNGTIIGVVKDFNVHSLYTGIEPALITARPDLYEFAAVKITGNYPTETINIIQQKWQKTYPQNVFEYHFLDDQLAEFYQKEEIIGKLITAGTIIAILISCLGLLGLISLMTVQRTKEIGIRKVLGASVAQITSLLSKDFLKLVLLALIIASPIAYFTMQKWLQGFAYRTNISWWVFALAGILALTIALATVSFQAIKAALANPVKSLRSE